MSRSRIFRTRLLKRQHASPFGDGNQRKSGPPRLKLTGIEFPQPGFRPAERIEETGARLKEFAGLKQIKERLEDEVALRLGQCTAMQQQMFLKMKVVTWLKGVQLKLLIQDLVLPVKVVGTELGTDSETNEETGTEI